MPEWINDLNNVITKTFSSFSYVDLVDIICVAFLLYLAYKFVRDRRAGKLAVGVCLFMAALIIAEIIELRAVQFIFKNIFQVGVIMIVIVFQPELRSLLEKIGGESIKGIKSIGESKENDEIVETINTVVAAAEDMSNSKTGALIVFEKSTRLGEYASTGTIINSDVTSLLLKNIFFNKAPLHDGAVIIRDNRIYAAACVLPLSTQSDLSHELGTRHRAAVGITENSDAVALVVSEETGMISVAHEGNLIMGLNTVTLKEKLHEHLIVHSVTDIIKAKNRLSKNKNIASKRKKNENAE